MKKTHGMKKAHLGLATLAAMGSFTGQAVAAGFIEDSTGKLELRNFYFNHDIRDTDSPTQDEWGQGFILNLQSGFTEGMVGFGADATYTLGVKLDAPGARSIFPADSDGEAVDNFSRGGLTGKMRVSKTEARYGILTPKLPILWSNDGRMLPQLFEGGQITSNEFDNLTLTGGQIEHVVGRMSSNFTGMAISGGTQESNHFRFAGGDYKLTKDLTLQYYFANLEDYYDQHFLGALHNLAVGPGVLKSDLRYFRTTSDGKNADLAKGYRASTNASGNDGELDNSTWSAKFTYVLSGHALTLGYQQVSDDSIFAQLNQGGLPNEGAGGTSTYVITDSLVQNFTYAGERTVLAGYAYDFTSIGAPGLTASVTYLKGDQIKTAVGSDRQEWERDIVLGYVVQSGSLKGFGVAWRNGVLRSDVLGDIDHNRLTLSYALPLW